MIRTALAQIEQRFGVAEQELLVRAGIAPSASSAAKHALPELDPAAERRLMAVVLAVIGPSAAALAELDDPGLMARQRAMTMGARLESGFALSRFTSELVGTARR